MRRFVFAPGKRTHLGPKRRAIWPVAEVFEARTFFSAAPAAPAAAIQFGVITGEVAQDVNQNGIFDGSDTPLAGQTVFLDLVGTGVYDPANDPTSSTDSFGTYVFGVTYPATYSVNVVPQAGLTVEPNSAGLAPISVTTATATNVPILEVPAATVHGTVFNDANANGVFDAGELGLPNRAVYADVNHNGVFDTSDISATTDSTGRYSLTNLPTSGTTPIRFVSGVGTVLTSPASGEHDVALTIGQTVNDLDFGTTGPDLSAQLLSTPQSLLIGGVDVKKALAVRITNTGQLQVKSLVGVTIWVSADTTIDGSDNIVGNLLGRPTSLKPGQSRVIRVHYAAPVNVVTGVYHVLAQVNTSVDDNNPSNDVSASPGVINVYQPFNDLGIQYASAPPTTVNPGRGFSVSILVTNNGDVQYTGTVSLQLYQSASPNFQSPEQVITGDGVSLARLANVKIKLRPQQSKVVTIPVVNITNRGLYFMLTLLTENNPLGDVNIVNNEAISQATTNLL